MAIKSTVVGVYLTVADLAGAKPNPVFSPYTYAAYSYLKNLKNNKF